MKKEGNEKKEKASQKNVGEQAPTPNNQTEDKANQSSLPLKNPSSDIGSQEKEAILAAFSDFDRMGGGREKEIRPSDCVDPKGKKLFIEKFNEFLIQSVGLKYFVDRRAFYGVTEGRYGKYRLLGLDEIMAVFHSPDFKSTGLESQSGHEAREIFSKLKSLQCFNRKEGFEDFFQTEDVPAWIKTDNKIYHWREGKTAEWDIHEQRPRYSFPFRIDPIQKCPTWDAYLALVVRSKKNFQLFKEFIGHALIGGVQSPFKKMLVLTGSGNNGKTTLMNGVESLFGRENTSQLDFGRLNRFGLSSIEDSMLNISDDENSRTIFRRMDVLKRITGGGLFQLERKGRPQHKGLITAKLIFCLNEVPSSSELSKAAMDRMLHIPFNFDFKKCPEAKFPDIHQRLKVEAGAFALQCLEAYKVLEKRGMFEETADTIRFVEEVKAESTPLYEWVGERGEIDQTLTGLWKEFLGENQIYPNSYPRGKFKKDLMDIIPKKVFEKKDKRGFLAWHVKS